MEAPASTFSHEQGREPTSQAGRLSWRCRRGTKELDVLLGRYLQQRYDGVSAAERLAFESLLELQDPQLQDYLSGHLEAPEPDTRRVIQHILTP